MSRRVGIEEELFLVDGAGRLVASATEVLRAHQRLEPDAELEHELFLQQVELQTGAHDDVAALRDDLVSQRISAVDAARAAGVSAVAMPLDVIGGSEPATTPNSRYERMLARYGSIGWGALSCGMHVHVEVDEEDAVRVVDALRPWTPLLMALTANAPFHAGRDTGHASWRGQLWDGWPSAGPAEPFGDLAGYRAAINDLVDSGAAIDEHMVYLDARLAERFPTIEVRVADVCTDVDQAVVVAALTGALVAVLDRASDAPAPWRVDLLRGARWRARHDGVGGHLLDPVSRRLLPAADALSSLTDFVADELDRAGTTQLVRDGVERALVGETGADRQRQVAGPDLDLTAVVRDLVRRTDPRSSDPTPARRETD